MELQCWGFQTRHFGFRIGSFEVANTERTEIIRNKHNNCRNGLKNHESVIYQPYSCRDNENPFPMFLFFFHERSPRLKETNIELEEGLPGRCWGIHRRPSVPVKCLQSYTRQHGSGVGSVRIVMDVEDVGARFVVIGACDLFSFTFSISCGTILGTLC